MEAEEITGEKLKQKYLQLQILQQQMEQLSEQMEQLSQQNAELDASVEAVKALEKQNPGTEFLAPVADGIFVAGSLKETNKLLVNMGADVAVEKTVQEVAALLEQQKDSLMHKMLEGDMLLRGLSSHAMKTYKEMEELGVKEGEE